MIGQIGGDRDRQQATAEAPFQRGSAHLVDHPFHAARVFFHDLIESPRVHMR